MIHAKRYGLEKIDFVFENLNIGLYYIYIMITVSKVQYSTVQRNSLAQQQKLIVNFFKEKTEFCNLMF